MRNNIFGYIFVVFIIIIMSFAVYKIKIQNKDDKKNETAVVQNGEVIKGKEMTLAISGFDTINPIITKNQKVQDIDKIIYEPLIEMTEDGKLVYKLAKESAKTSGNTYIIKLKQGIKWSDGTKFTSDDVKFTIDKLKENNNSVYSQSINSVQEVDILDNYTLKIILSKEIPNFEYYLTFPILSNSYYANTDFWNTEKNKEPITTGQFKIAQVNNNTIVLEKNGLWWNKETTSIINKITINLYTSVAELYNAFKMGSIDFISTQNANYPNYIGTIGYDTAEIEGRELVFLALNTKNGLLSDANVRRAVRASIDKNRVLANSYGNMYKTSNFLLNTNSYLVDEQNEEHYNPDDKGYYLNESGWENKNGVWQKIIDYRTNRVELNLVVRAADGTRCRAAEDIRNQLMEQGIIVNIIYADDTSYDGYLNNMNYDMMLCSVNQPIAPDLTTYFGDGNLANYYNQEVSEIMNFIKNNNNETELKGKYQRLYEIYNDEVPYIGIARNKIMGIKNTNLVGEIRANWYNMFYGINEWYTTNK